MRTKFDITIHTMDLTLWNTQVWDLYDGKRSRGNYKIRPYSVRQCLTLSIFTRDTMGLILWKSSIWHMYIRQRRQRLAPESTIAITNAVKYQYSTQNLLVRNTQTKRKAIRGLELIRRLVPKYAVEIQMQPSNVGSIPKHNANQIRVQKTDSKINYPRQHEL